MQLPVRLERSSRSVPLQFSGFERVPEWVFVISFFLYFLSFCLSDTFNKVCKYFKYVSFSAEFPALATLIFFSSFRRTETISFQVGLTEMFRLKLTPEKIQ